MILREAREHDRDSIIALLDAESLPTSDLAERSMEHFIVAGDQGLVVACIGAEMLGELALLRSLVVGEAARRRGLAARLVETLEQRLVERGVAEVWLLTIDASGFFLRHGYSICSREGAPERVRQTDEFSSLCPGSATLMCKPLAAA